MSDKRLHSSAISEGARAFARDVQPRFGPPLATRRGGREGAHENAAALQSSMPLLVLLAGLACLVLAFSLLPGPLTAPQVFIALGVGLTAIALYLAFAAGLGSGASEMERVGARIERRLERLQDKQWELSESEARYRGLLDAQDEAIVRRDADGKLTFVNKAFLEMFALTADQALGRPFVAELYEASAVEPLSVADGARRRRSVQHVVTAAGPRWIEWEEHVVSNPGDETFEVQSIGRDVTEQRRAEAQLAEACDQAEAANRAKSRFLAAMSHEIRTPMNGILGMSSLLLDTPQTAEQQTYVRAIDQSARTLVALIDEILDFSKIEAGKLELSSAPFGLEACVQNAVELLAPRAHEKGLEIAWSVSPTLPRLVCGDEARVRQILLNLISNAVKFTDAGGVSIKVGGSAEPGDRIRIDMAVEDTGIGISAEDMRGLFTEFEQAEAAIKRRDGGTGLGLAISMQLARAMGGEIRVASQRKAGSTFTAVIVLQRAAEAIGGETQIADAGTAGARALLAFDRRLERRTLHEALAASGVSAVACDFAAGGEALDAAAREGAAFDRVIIDGAEGAASAGRLLAQARALREQGDVRGIVVLDVLARAGLAGFRAAGFDGYLVRPVRPASMMRQLGLSGEPPAPAECLFEVEDSAAPWVAPGPARRVLLAEDNEINLLLAKRVLEKCGCAYVAVNNGADAVAAARRALAGEGGRIDLILMDIFMPQMDGMEAAREIKTLYAATPGAAAPPIVALTANAFAEDKRRYLEAGLDDYLAKPFDKAGLEAVLRRWFGALPGGDANAA